jgi:hypothetical protein
LSARSAIFFTAGEYLSYSTMLLGGTVAGDPFFGVAAGEAASAAGLGDDCVGSGVVSASSAGDGVGVGEDFFRFGLAEDFGVALGGGDASSAGVGLGVALRFGVELGLGVAVAAPDSASEASGFAEDLGVGLGGGDASSAGVGLGVLLRFGVVVGFGVGVGPSDSASAAFGSGELAGVAFGDGVGVGLLPGDFRRLRGAGVGVAKRPLILSPIDSSAAADAGSAISVASEKPTTVPIRAKPGDVSLKVPVPGARPCSCECRRRDFPTGSSR